MKKGANFCVNTDSAKVPIFPDFVDNFPESFDLNIFIMKQKDF